MSYLVDFKQFKRFKQSKANVSYLLPYLLLHLVRYKEHSNDKEINMSGSSTELAYPFKFILKF